MAKGNGESASGPGKGLATLVLGTLLAAGAVTAQVPNVQVLKPDGLTAVDAYRWVIEEDVTHGIVPGQSCLNGNLQSCLSVDFHRSYMPVIAQGRSGEAFPNLDPAKRYFISVLPDTAGVAGGDSLGGAPIRPGQQTVTVTVNALPLPTAQIRVFVFEDNYPINNAPDTPEEQGLAGFSIQLHDAGGRYGVSGGQVVQDAFGNPLGTTYQRNPDGTAVLDPDGAPVVQQLGNGLILTDPEGVAQIKNLAPGKYGIVVVPPAGQGWVQTSTIEGTNTIDAWVKANEPPFFTEFGPPGPHVFVGFIRPTDELGTLDGTTRTTLTGQVRAIHSSRPPNFAFYTGRPVGGCWVGLNELSVGIGRGVYAAPCNADSTFQISNIPPGNYQLAVWDANLGMIFAATGLTVDADGRCNGGPCNLLDVPVFPWYARLESYVFNDLNENGFWDLNEPPIPEQAVNLRFRDGTLYQSFATDVEGAAPFDEVFPFFSWLVAEVDFARLKATGATILADDGGAIDPADPWSFDGALRPQAQMENGGLPYRVETGPVLTQAFQAFLGQTNVIQWGKTAYAPGDNGGISGIVYYATTRAENDPRYAAAEPWEPGIPRLQVNLYQDIEGDGSVDDLNNDGGPTYADIDNYPYGWRDGSAAKGPEDFDWNGNGTFDAGDAIQVAYTDSWDDSLPSGCQGAVYYVDGNPANPTDCYDGLRNFNQVRPGVFDGGYAFGSHYPGGISSGGAEQAGLPVGTYIVEAGRHPGYELVKEEDRNVDFGDVYVPAPQLLPPECVGDARLVPDTLSLLGSEPAPFAGTERPLCDRKKVLLTDGHNAAADFFLFTQVPIAGHVVGFILDDLSNEFDPNAPTFGEKYSPPFLPVSIRDWTGKEISRTYSDRWGRFNALVPSTYTANLPMASGMSPSMLIACMNSPGPIADPATGQLVTDPHFNRQYSQFCYTFNYMPGTTTYLDTPVVPVAAFAGANQFPLDCECGDGTPIIDRVMGPTAAGPYVPQAGDELTLVSVGPAQVPNPAFGAPGEPKLITRDFGFGDVQGQILLDGAPLADAAITAWTNDSISFAVPASGRLTLVRGDNAKPSVTGINVTLGGPVVQVAPGGSIQAAIDVAQPGDLVLVPPGTYDEMVLMWKPVRLQGSGASTLINAVKAPGEKLTAWRNKVRSLVTSGAVDLLPAQEVGFNLPEPVTLFTEEGAGITVLAKDAKPRQGGFGVDRNGRPNAGIDGFTITGADNGGAIFVNGYADYLEISNNRIFGNRGIYGGGVRIGHPYLVADNGPQGVAYQDGDNDGIWIHHNWISENGATGGAGGGISLHHGSDDYRVTDNFVCGNFTQGDGGGIGHLGRVSDGDRDGYGGVIARNRIIANHSFNQLTTVSGGGLFIGGSAPAQGIGLTDGSGSVLVDGNIIQGNFAGAGDGGGIRTAMVNGNDVTGSGGNNPLLWHRVDILNNIIVNNIAGLAGGGISLQDSARVAIVNNTIANNDSTATAGEAFPPGSPNQSTPQPAGVVSRAHSDALAAVFGKTTKPDYGIFSNPRLVNNIIWHNRSFYFFIDQTQDPPFFGLLPDPVAAVYSDLAVLGTGDPAHQLTAQSSILSGGGDPLFAGEYFNGAPGQTILYPEAKTSLAPVPAFDEGGNFIDVRFGPHSPFGDYHIGAGSSALGGADGTVIGDYPQLLQDIDGDTRDGGGADIGADELVP